MITIKTKEESGITKTTVILNGKLTSKDKPVGGVGFCMKEGTSGDPTEKDQIVGVITGDVPVCPFASTIIGLKPNTFYRFRAGTATEDPSYTVEPNFPGIKVVGDNQALSIGPTYNPIVYTATTKQLVIAGVWHLDFSISGTFTSLVPVEMGGDGLTVSITFEVNTAKLPLVDVSGDYAIVKSPVTYYFGETKQFKTNK